MNEEIDSFSIVPFPASLRYFMKYICTDAVNGTEFRFFDLPFILTIGNNAGISQKKLSIMLGFDKSYTTRIVKYLISNNIVENRTTGKTHSLYLTDKGLEGYDLSMKASNNFLQIMFSGFSENDKTEFMGFVERIKDNIDKCLEK